MKVKAVTIESLFYYFRMGGSETLSVRHSLNRKLKAD